MTAGSVVPDALLMFLGTVSHVGFPAIERMSQCKAAHELIADLLGDDAGGGDGGAVRVPVDEGFVRVAEFRERESIDQDLPGFEAAKSTEDTADGAAHGDGGGNPDVEAVDLANRGGGNGDPEGTLANAGDEPLTLGRAQQLGVAKAGDALDVSREDDRGGHDGAREWTATDFIDADEQVTDSPAGFLLAECRSGRRGARHGLIKREQGTGNREQGTGDDENKDDVRVSVDCR